MSITLCPVTDNFVAEIYDIDLGQSLDAATVDEIKSAFWRFRVLIFPDQHIDHDQHVAFASHFGPMDQSIVKAAVSDTPLRLRGDIADVSNLGHDNEIWGKDSRLRQLQLGNRLWHTDSSFKYVPALCSMLYALAIPPVGGQTEFADQRAAYDALPQPMRQRLQGMIAEHSLMYSRERMGYTEWGEDERNSVLPVPQVMVRTVPQTGRKNLYIASHAWRVIGMDDSDAIALIDELLAHASQRQFVHTHRWRERDLVMWDNRCTMHRGLPFDDLRFRRDMQRATVLDVANTCEQEGVPLPSHAAA